MVMVLNATFNNISVISWRSAFIGGGQLYGGGQLLLVEVSYIVEVSFYWWKLYSQVRGDKH